MTYPAATNRNPEAAVDEQFIQRWSPRAYDSRPVEPEKLAAVFEAARWAPSSGNGQPWLFLYASTPESLKLFRPILVDANREWADTAPVLIAVMAQRNRANGKPNGTAAFDTGAAWMALALQAKQLGLITHGMAGFHEDEFYARLNVPREEYLAIAMVALGYAGDAASLSDRNREREVPSDRKPLAEVAREGALD